MVGTTAARNWTATDPFLFLLFRVEEHHSMEDGRQHLYVLFGT